MINRKNNTLKIVTVIGARPQFIKTAVVSDAFKKSGKIKEIIVHTGQHFDANMSEIFFHQMQIPVPDYSLNIHSSNHGAMTGEMLIEIEKVLLKEMPDWVLVYGDTNSTLAGVLAASKLHIKIAHVEAGLRSFNLKMPEETNRIVADRLSSKLFCPTETAKHNLIQEGFQSSNINADITFTGDVMYDAALYFSKMSTNHPTVLNIINAKKPFILATIHRAENTNDRERLANIFHALNTINKTISMIMPLHPRTRRYLTDYGIKTEIHFIDPIGYIEMLYLLKRCALIITDSGGLQKEAYFFDKYCITARDETEWIELVDCGYNVLVGADSKKIMDTFNRLLSRPFPAKQMLYGKGNAAELIADCIFKK